MPTLDWIGKKAVVNHHNEVPFHLLKEAPELLDLLWRGRFISRLVIVEEVA